MVKCWDLEMNKVGKAGPTNVAPAGVDPFILFLLLYYYTRIHSIALGLNVSSEEDPQLAVEVQVKYPSVPTTV